MAEYIERQKTLDTVRKHKWNIVGTEEKVNENVLVDAIALDIYEDIPIADVVERAEYDKVLKENEGMKAVLSGHYEIKYNELRSKINKAIEEMGRYGDGFDYIGKHDLASAVENCIKLLKGNI